MSNEELVLKIQAGETDLIPVLWKQVERLIKLLAYKFYTANTERCASVGVGLDDLFQQGYFALLSAINAYDVSKEFSFNTYLSFHAKKEFSFIAKMRSTGWQNKKEPISLDAIAHENKDGDGVSILDMISDPDAEKDMENVIDKEYTERLHNDLMEAMESLTEQQRKVIIQVYFKGAVSYSAAAKFLNMHGETLHRLHDSALKKLARDEKIKAYKNDIIDRYGRGYGFERWKNLGMSPQERAILELEKRGLL